MVSIFARFRKKQHSPEPIVEQHSQQPIAISVDDLEPSNYSNSGYANTNWNGDKFYDGFGITKDYEIVDYDLLRRRSKQIFFDNLYARGLIRRLITNIIGTGLTLEATPDKDTLSLDSEYIAQWSERVEKRFSFWSKNPKLCDFKKLRTFGAIQRQAEMMAMVSGDVLCVLRVSTSGLPTIDLIDASKVQSPMNDTMHAQAKNRGNKITRGVELDPNGRHIAFYVRQDDGSYIRIASEGARTKRKQAWLHYANEKLIDDVRGQPLLSLVVQSLKEVDRYRDAEQRAAVINSMIAMWVKKTEDKIGSLPISGGAVRRDIKETQNDSQGRKDVQFSSNMPGMILQELQQGEEPVSYDTRRPNVNFQVFESAIIDAIAWAHEMPPEILKLSFKNNYSASRAAVQEFQIFIDKKCSEIADEFLNPIYQEFLVSEVLNGSVQADGLLESRTNQQLWHIYGAWMSCDWAGVVKPSVDLYKEVKAHELMLDKGLITYEKSARYLTGMKYSKVVSQLKKENMQLAEALEPLINSGLTKHENPNLINDEDLIRDEDN